MKRYSLFFAILIASLNSSWAQTITVGATPTNLSCGGGNVDLTALGTSVVPVFGDDFNTGQVAPGWAASASAQFDNPCGPSVDGSTYLWMGPGTAAPREMTTASVDVSCGGTVCFDFKFVCESCGDSAPCEGADTYAEGVSLQYSTNGGATWTDFAYFAPNGDLLTAYPGNVYSPYASGNTPFTTWNNYCFTIPAGAETAGTIFQLHQWGSSGTQYDHWGIDNFFINANPCAPYYYDWDHIPGSPDAPDVTTNITETTTFTCCYTDGTTSVCESVTVTVETIDITALTIGTEPCLGDNAGTVSVSASGGAPPYTYTLAGPTPGTNGSGNFSNLAPGNYTVTINDGGSCLVDSSFTIDPGPACCTVSATGTDALCNAEASGTVTANPANGVAPYSYQWDAGTGNQTTQTANNLLAGTYTVTITDFNGCQSTTSVDIGEPLPLNSSATPTDAQCNGVCDGQIVISVPTGGTSPYQFNLNGGSFGASGTFTGLCAGNYNLITQDDNGCQVIMSNVPVNEPLDLTLNEQSTVAATCGASNGELTVLAGGGSPAYQYDIGGAQQASATFNGLTAGTYTVTVTDDNLCTETVDVTVGSAAGPAPSVDSQSPVTCAGGLNGSVTIATGGGSAPFTFSLDGGLAQTSNTFPVSAGNHTVTVTDGNGCSGDVNFTINEPTPLTYSTVVTDASCNGDCDGQIEITAQDATPPYQYSDDNGLTFQASNILTGLCAGNVNVVVKDDNGCLANSVEPVGEPTPVVSTSAFVEPSCFGLADGEISFNPSGGTPGYTFSVDNGVSFSAPNPQTGIAAGTYDLVVKDANDCEFIDQITVTQPPQFSFNFIANNPSNCGASDGSFEITAANGLAPYFYSIDGGVTQQINNGFFNNLFSGLYNLVVEDANGCVDSVFSALSDNVMITQTDLEQGTTCFGACDGVGIVSQQFGSPPFTYTINTGGTQGNGVFGGLCAGQYFITIEDDGLCIGIQEVNITEPDTITFTPTAVEVSCPSGSDGEINFGAVTGGDGGPYQYSIDGGVTFQASAVFTGLTTGTYDLVAMDGNSCLGATTLFVDEPAPWDVVINSTNLTCYQNATGFIQIVAGGATGPYTYDLSGTPSGTGIYAGLAAANYDVTVTDANLCVFTTTQLLTEPDELTANYVGTDALCNGSADGQFEVNAAGGTLPYLYSADNGNIQQSSNVLVGLTDGCYDIHIEDNNGCILVSNECIAEPTPVTMTMVMNPATCGLDNADVTITADGGTPGYQYSNDNGLTLQASNAFTGLAAANFVIVVEDLNGCQIDSLITLSSDQLPSIDNIVSNNPLCFNSTDGDITVSSSGGVGAHGYSLNPAGPFNTGNTFNGLGDGTYDIYVEDGNGCIATQQVVLEHPAAIGYNVAVTDLLCNNDFSGEISLTATGGTSPFNYSIDGGVSTQAGGTFSFIAAGTYDIQVADVNGCQITGNEDVNEPTAVAWDPAFTVTDPLCFNACDGTVNAPGTGGTPLGTAPFYTYNWSGNISTSTSSSAVNVCAGNYNLSITDDNGCSIDTNITLIDPAALIIPGLTVVDLACYEGYQDLSAPVQNFDGDITITTPTTGLAPYNYSIDGGTSFQLGNQFSGLAAGNYDIVVTDANGCEAISNTTVYQPDSLYSIAPSDWPACFGETVTVQAFTNGGSVPYTSFEWTNSLNATVETNAIFDVVVTQDVTYTYQVTDANGCLTAPVSYSINPTSELMLTPGPDEMICVGDNVDITVTAVGGELIDFGTYQGYSYSWDTGVAGDTLEIINVGPVVETVFTVTVTDQCGAVKDTFVTVGIHPDPITDVLGGGNGCVPDTMSFENPSFLPGTTVLWDFGNGVTSTDPNPSNIVFVDPGCFDVTLTAVSDQGCTTSSTYTDLVCIYEDPIPGFYTNPSSPSILDPTTTVISTASNAASWYYTFDGFGTSTEENPTITFPVEEEVTVNICQTVTSAEGCTASICSPIEIYEEILFYIPNVFTPDGDLFNETFHPVITSGIDMFDYHLTIFNRWGEIIFESYNYDFGWNGHYGSGGLVDDGVYIWQIEFGEKLSDKKQTHRGHVTVLK